MALHILLLDDDPVAGVLAERMLERLGYPAPVWETNAGSVASWSRFDVVLADVGVLEMRHHGVFDALMQDGVPSRPRVILLGAGPDADSWLGSAAVDARLAKPLALQALAAALSSVNASGVGGSDFDATHWRDLLDAFGRDGVRQLVDAVTRDLPIRQAQYAQARRDRDPALLRRMAHALRGACLQMSAHRLVLAATVVEEETDVETAFAGGVRLLEDYAALVARLDGEVARL